MSAGLNGEPGDAIVAEARAEVVLAAGGVVLRRNQSDVEVAVVHRPRRQDWTLPKGKLEPGETHEACALREVEEETGFRCLLGEELGTVGYTDRHGRPKVVRYWLMGLEGGSFRPSEEVDEMCWIPVGAAGNLLTYGHDREMVEVLAAEVAGDDELLRLAVEAHPARRSMAPE